MAAQAIRAGGRPAGRRPRTSPGAGSGSTHSWSSRAVLPLPLWIMLLTSVKTMDEIRLGNILALPTEFTISPGSRPGRRPAPGSPAGHQRRLLELGADPDPLGDPVDPDRRAQRLRAVLLAGARRGPAVRDPPDRRLHPTRCSSIAGPAVLDGRHLQLAAGDRRGPHHLRHADHDAPVPQLLLVAAARAVQCGAGRRRRLPPRSSGA